MPSETLPEETTTKRGWCHDCAQGILQRVDAGFALYRDDDGNDAFWYCRYCGSNHVTLLDEEGNSTSTQGDLYEMPKKITKEKHG